VKVAGDVPNEQLSCAPEHTRFGMKVESTAKWPP
jgi:hypothetical protein